MGPSLGMGHPSSPSRVGSHKGEEPVSSQCLVQLSLSSLQLGRRFHHMEGAVLASCVRVFRGGSHWGGVKVSGRPRLEPGVGGSGDLVRRDVKSSGIGSGRSLFQVRG